MQHSYSRIRGSFDHVDDYRTAVRCLKSGSVIAEIGCGLGRSTSFLAVESINLGISVKIYAIDTFDFDYHVKSSGDNYRQASDNLAFLENVTVLWTSSSQAAAVFDPASVDMLVYDGDRYATSFRNETTAWLTKMRPGGLLLVPNHWGMDVAVPQVIGSRAVKLNRCWLAPFSPESCGDGEPGQRHQPQDQNPNPTAC